MVKVPQVVQNSVYADVLSPPSRRSRFSLLVKTIALASVQETALFLVEKRTKVASRFGARSRLNMFVPACCSLKPHFLFVWYDNDIPVPPLRCTGILPRPVGGNVIMLFIHFPYYRPTFRGFVSTRFMLLYMNCAMNQEHSIHSMR